MSARRLRVSEITYPRRVLRVAGGETRSGFAQELSRPGFKEMALQVGVGVRHAGVACYRRVSFVSDAVAVAYGYSRGLLGVAGV